MPQPISPQAYHVAEAKSRHDLHGKAAFYLKEGWSPLGGISISHSFFGGSVYAQAFLKQYAPPTPPTDGDDGVHANDQT